MFGIDPNIDSGDAVDLQMFMQWNTDVHDVLNSYVLANIRKLPVTGTIVVTNVTEARPDLLSYYVYESTDYWWVLMEMNEVTNVSDITAGMVIKYPSIESIESLVFTAATL